MEKLEHSYRTGRCENGYNHCGKLAIITKDEHIQTNKQYFFLAVLFLGIYSTEMQTYVHQKTYTRIATAALFIRVSKMETTQMSISRIEE